LTAEDFRVNVRTAFKLSGGSSGSDPAIPFEVELVEVAEHAASTGGAFRVPFSLLFHGPLGPVMPQAIYRLDHEQLGALEVFVVPVGPAEPAVPGEAPTKMRYEVVFG
jgi:hypothetical protein